jgi:hypothetical protein
MQNISETEGVYFSLIKLGKTSAAAMPSSDRFRRRRRLVQSRCNNLVIGTSSIGAHGYIHIMHTALLRESETMGFDSSTSIIQY